MNYVSCMQKILIQKNNELYNYVIRCNKLIFCCTKSMKLASACNFAENETRIT